MRFKQKLMYPVFTFVFTIVSCFTILSNAIGEPMQKNALYTDLEPDVFMKEWLVLGPIPVFEGEPDTQDIETQKKAFSNDFLTQYGGESGIKPEADSAYEIKGKEYKWQVVKSDDDIISLDKVYPDQDYVIAYAWAKIEMPEAKDAILGVGSDDSIRIWLNGELIHDNWIPRPVSKDDDLVPIKLKEGNNTLLLKVQDIQGNWGFVCRPLSSASMSERFVSAAGEGKLDMIDMLLAHGVDINAKNEMGLTALHFAKIKGRKDTVDLLIKKGADPDIKMPSSEELADGIFNKAIKGNSPGAAVLVSKDGEIVYQKAFGFADLGHKIPVTLDTKFRIGSITKQFTASAILKLQEEGKLSVDDKLSKFIPDYPRGDEVTIHHLLTHTSGIHSFTGKPDFIKNAPVAIKPEDQIESFKNDPFDFNPGEKFAYNNSGYFLLGYIVSKVSGETYDDYLKKTFFEPLGMKNTGVHNSTDILENEAVGYSYIDNKFQKALNWDMSQAGGAGALYSTVGDLYLWNKAIFNGEVLSDSSLKSAFTPVALNDGTKPTELGADYGYGWMFTEVRGMKEISHGGGLQGFNSYLAHYPDMNIDVVVLQNCVPFPPGMDATSLARGVMEMLFWDQLGSQESYAVDETIDSSNYDDYVGRYDYGMGAILVVTKEEDKLFAQMTGQQKFEIFPRSKDVFFWKVAPASIEFIRNEDGEVFQAIHRQSGMERLVTKLEEEAQAEVDPAVYDAYVGEYNLREDVNVQIIKEDNKLFAQITGQPKIEIFPRSESEFFMKVAKVDITFVKDETGKVVKLTLDQAGMKFDANKIE